MDNSLMNQYNMQNGANNNQSGAGGMNMSNLMNNPSMAMNGFSGMPGMSGMPNINMGINGIPMQNNANKLQELMKINSQLDQELLKLGNKAQGISNYTPTRSQTTEELSSLISNQMPNRGQMQFPQFMSVDSSSPNNNMNRYISGYQKNALANQTKNSPLCIRREGMLKIRDVDQKDKDVVVTYSVLTKDRLSYFVNAKDESSIQGSIELSKIKESLKLINGFPTCFTLKTIDGVSDCSICAESEDSARDWINAITQNAVNCNASSVLNSINK